MPKYFGTYGIRGLINFLTPEFTAAMSAAFATWLGGTIVVGRDTRTTGEMLERAVISGLLSAGCDVIELGTVPSPTVEFEVKRLGAAGGVIITASHNPPEWNALKFVGKEGVGLSREKGEEIEAIYERRAQRRAEWDRQGTLSRHPSAISEHIAEIEKHVDERVIRRKSPLVVLDCANGTAGLMAPQLMRRLGCRIITLNAQPDGRFPGRPSEPTEENIGDLIGAVKALRADLGIAWDGDADRVIFVDERGRYIWGDRSFALCAKLKLMERKGDVVTTIATSNVVKDVAVQGGGKIVYTKVGAPYISEAMLRRRAVIGGEEVGGVVWPEIGWGKDGLMTAAKVVEAICRFGKLSKLISSLPKYFNAKTKVMTGDKDKQKVLERVKAVMGKEEGELITIDGLRLNTDEGWVIVRPSGTENLMRVFAEAGSQGKAAALLQRYRRIVEDAVRDA